jgi:hypothetical protein
MQEFRPLAAIPMPNLTLISLGYIADQPGVVRGVYSNGIENHGRGGSVLIWPPESTIPVKKLRARTNHPSLCGRGDINGEQWVFG